MNVNLNQTTLYPSPLPDATDGMVRQTLATSLGYVDGAFGIQRILADTGIPIVDTYYRQSLPGYASLYNQWQCMHVALHDTVNTEKQAFFAQASAVSKVLGAGAGQRVLELGCGLGANTLHLAESHPDVDFVAIDLMPEHVKRATLKAQDLPNARFQCASFENLPRDLGTFDVILAVETLCYATNLNRVAAQIAQHLRPGGQIILFDAHRRDNFDSLPADSVTATRLYEITTAVTRGFHTDGAWERAFVKAGLDLTASDDLTAKTLTGLSSLHRRSMKAFTDLKWRLALKVMPRHLARNTVAGLLGYHVCFGGGTQPDPDRGAVRYQRIVARKPRN
ncbi:class I SAM-dependent methyltransferase [Pararhodobacter zhoushanensis]|uniref:Class I SAM-dependent methyltransferase n=1 Tax=Pararhodobacter zhoushanensis TaxID=2479545 RepID=A0ABT3GWC0_9RHOB|nr:class I SAM-dependent methyltransferase [Pararhodobacter zhoushanensis]MCW1931827.1 class I SAM-dependent methyltransferase [Pararhodobacter zhoushanensis]